MAPSRPFVHLNFAVDTRGRMGSESGGSLPISTAEDWRRVHGLREQAQAVAVGGRTWIADRPRLTARADHLGRPPRRQPDRVVFAGGHDCEFVRDPRRTFVIGRQAPPIPGVVFSYCCDHDLAQPLETLSQQGVRSLLVEGGPTLLRSFLGQRCFDRLTLFVRTDDVDRGLALARRTLPELPEMLGRRQDGGVLFEHHPHLGSNGKGPGAHQELLEISSGARLPTDLAEFRVKIYQGTDGAHHAAILLGEVGDGEPVLARIHSECFTGDVLGSLRCDCGPQLELALRSIAERGRGVVVYLRQEGRGIGLLEKMKAYSLQDTGLDTVEANVRLGHPPDARSYGVAVDILDDLGVSAVRLLTNNPTKVRALESQGLRVAERLPARIEPNPENAAYLCTKRDKLGHWIDGEVAANG